MSKDQTRQNLGNIASNFRHLANFLGSSGWRLKLPRIKQFIVDTKERYSRTEIKNKNLIKMTNDFFRRKDFEDNKIAAEESLLLSVRFQNLISQEQLLRS